MDLGTIANAARPARSAGTLDARAGAERIALSPRLLLPMLQGQALGNPALAELARDVRAQLVSGERAVTLVLPLGAASDAQPARIDVGARQVTIPAALRDALLAQLGRPASASAASPLPAAAASAGLVADDEAARAWVVSTQTHAAASQLLAGQAAAINAGAARELVRALAPRASAATRDQAMPSVGYDQPVVDSALLEAAPVTAIGAIKQRVQQQFERSGMFFESHLAQWASGVRSSDELRAELVQLNRSGQTSGEPNAQRVAAQLAVLEQQAVTLAGPAWAGQPMHMTIEREARSPDAPADMPPVFSATLALDLPRLGRVEVELRLAGKAVATTVRSDDTAFRADLPALIEQLQARGLTPVAAHAAPLEDAP
jgi:hypothetical protein